MNPLDIVIARKISSRQFLYIKKARFYRSKASRKAAYRDIATELIAQGHVVRITPATVKRQYYRLRAQYRQVQKLIHARPALLRNNDGLNAVQQDIYDHMSFLNSSINYKNGQPNY